MLNVGRKNIYIHIYIHVYICIYVYTKLYIYIFEICSVFYRRFYIFKYSKTEILKSAERVERRNFSCDNAWASFSFSKMIPFQGIIYLWPQTFLFTIMNHSIFPFYEETYRWSLSPVEIFRKEENFHWNHFVISMNLLLISNEISTNLIPAVLVTIISKNEKWKENKWSRTRAFHTHERILRMTLSFSKDIFQKLISSSIF